jgi:hypothetical protein
MSRRRAELETTARKGSFGQVVEEVLGEAGPKLGREEDRAVGAMPLEGEAVADPLAVLAPAGTIPQIPDPMIAQEGRGALVETASSSVEG